MQIKGCVHNVSFLAVYNGQPQSPLPKTSKLKNI